jgi:hypothetical protein
MQKTGKRAGQVRPARKFKQPSLWSLGAAAPAGGSAPILMAYCVDAVRHSFKVNVLLAGLKVESPASSPLTVAVTVLV